MTNFERWQSYTKHIGSPDIFLSFGFYSLIAACLQRRVWVGPAHSPLFPNLYVILCGGPGTGKGMVIKPVKSFLSHWKRHTAAEQEQIRKQAERELSKNKRVSPTLFANVTGETTNFGSKKLNDEPLLFPIASESFGSYQALVQAMAESYDGMHYKKADGTSGAYLHSSMSMVLEELASLFRKHSDDLANFLLETYDCGDYRYETISRQKDRIKNCCFNLLAGTTPAFMQETLDDRLTNEGFASRTFFICAERPRFSEIFIPELDSEQQMARIHILQHIKSLKELYGGCTYTQDAKGFLIDWWRKFADTPRPNSSPKLTSYYARKNIHVQKLAMCIHFAEHTNNVITLEEVKKAMFMLDDAEKNMHLALTFRGNNPLTVASRALERFLESRKKSTMQEMTVHLWEYCNRADLQQIIEAYIAMGKLESFDTDEDKKIRFRLKEPKK